MLGQRKERTCIGPNVDWTFEFNCRIYFIKGKCGLSLKKKGIAINFREKQDHGVEKIYHLESDTLETECPGLIYICRPKLKYMRYIASK